MVYGASLFILPFYITYIYIDLHSMTALAVGCEYMAPL